MSASDTPRALVIRYHMRLGDILRCLPIARHFADRGRTVMIECMEEYHSLFRCVSYCSPVAPNGARQLGPVDVFDLQIWPDRYADYRASGRKWMDYVYGLYPQLADIDRRILLDTVPETGPFARGTYVACFPTGYSQMRAVPWSWTCQYAADLCTDGRRLVVCDTTGVFTSAYRAPDIPSLVALIRDAHQVVTINSAPTIIASAVRDSWIHIPDRNPQDDYHDTRQTRRDFPG